MTLNQSSHRRLKGARVVQDLGEGQQQQREDPIHVEGVDLVSALQKEGETQPREAISVSSLHDGGEKRRWLCAVNAVVQDSNVVAVADAIVERIKGTSGVQRVVLALAANVLQPQLPSVPHVWGEEGETGGKGSGTAAADIHVAGLPQLPASPAVQIDDKLLSTLLHLLRVARLPTICILLPAKRTKELGQSLEVTTGVCECVCVREGEGVGFVPSERHHLRWCLFFPSSSKVERGVESWKRDFL